MEIEKTTLQNCIRRNCDMSDGLDVIIVDDDPITCKMLTRDIETFYTWGRVVPFTDPEAARTHCMESEIGIAIFVVDVFLGEQSGFFFLDSVETRFPSVYEDTIVISGNASEEVVDICVASGVHYLLEKPIKKYALQLAIRSIVNKYLRFSKKLLENPDFASMAAKL